MRMDCSTCLFYRMLTLFDTALVSVYPACMQMEGLFKRAVLTVGEATAYLRALLEGDEILADVWVRGEVTNLSQPASGHIYFTLKDAQAAMRCVIWRSHANRMQSSLRDGTAVEAHGAVTVYEKGGQYQLSVDGLRNAGEGALYEEFLRLKEKLQNEGLFDTERKRPLPAYPRVIGVITSPSGAALQDILNTLRTRYPLAQVVIAPTPVQGDEAPPQIVRAFKLVRAAKPDVILLARGGGSLEDLWAFNDERVVRAVVASPIPVVSGVGHETDFTLSDFAADVRAPTPTGAAVAATPDITDLQAQLAGSRFQIASAARGALRAAAEILTEVRHRLDKRAPGWQVQQGMQRVDELGLTLSRAVRHNLNVRIEHFNGLFARLAALDPRLVMKRGFAMLTDSAGQSIPAVAALKVDQAVSVRLWDGKFGARVTDIILEQSRETHEKE